MEQNETLLTKDGGNREVENGIEAEELEKQIEDMEHRFGKAILEKYRFLDLTEESLYCEAAEEVRKIVDERVRPYSGEKEQKALDAYRYFHDKSFIPSSWIVDHDGQPAIPCEFNKQLEINPKSFFGITDWGGSENYDKVSDFSPFITHFWGYDDIGTVSEFLKKSKGKYPEYYLSVIGKLVETIESLDRYGK